MRTLFTFLLLTISTVLFAQSDFTAPSDAKSIILNGHLTGVRVSSGIKLMLTAGETNTASYTIASDDLTDGFSAELKKGILYLGMNYDVVKKNSRKYKKANIVVYLSAKDISSMSASSGAVVKTSGTFTSTNCEMQCSSGASLDFSTRATNGSIKVSSGAVAKISGAITNASVDISSGSTLKGKDLMLTNVSAKASSGASAIFGINGALKAKVSSGASILYIGTPKETKIEKSSGGSVSPKSR